MFNKIVVPVDLTHQEHLGRALRAAADLAKHYEASLVFVGVTTNTPSSIAHTPKEFEAKLREFAEAQASSDGVEASAHSIVAHDPTIDMNQVLLKAIEEIGADLVVMQSHIPSAVDYVWPSHGGYVAEHSEASVMLIR